MSSRSLCNLVLLATLATVVAAGCGQAAPERAKVFKTAGKITFHGQPPAGALVVLHPKGAAPDAPRPIAHVQADGSFAATTFDTADGAPAGQYVVTVQWQKLVNIGGEWQPGPNLLPSRYASPATSHVIVHVAEGQNELPIIALR
jgi:hypothetical protein